LKGAVHIGYSTGGGEVARYIARHGESRVAKAVLISAVPPIMVKTEANPGGLPKKVFDDFQASVAANRAQFFRDVAAGPFYGFNRPGAKVDEGVIQNWWRQGMMGGIKAHYDGIVAFSQTDFTPDQKKITVPTLVMHGDDDQIVPYADAGPLSAKLVKSSTLKTYKALRTVCARPTPIPSIGICSRLSKGDGSACSAHRTVRLSPTIARLGTSPVCGRLRTNAICYGPFTRGAAKQMETE
jgi:pimeloyl-ACP methyl ester carboxylesterase